MTFRHTAILIPLRWLHALHETPQSTTVSIRSNLPAALASSCDNLDPLAALLPLFSFKTQTRAQHGYHELLAALRTYMVLPALLLVAVMRPLGIPLYAVISSFPYRIVTLDPTGGRGMVSWSPCNADRYQVGHRGDLRPGIDPVGGISVIVFDRVYPRLFVSCGPHRQDGYRSEVSG